jgi:hypothetical protein
MTDQPKLSLTASFDPSYGSCSSTQSWIPSRSPSLYLLRLQRWWSKPSWSNGVRLLWTWFLLAFYTAPWKKKWRFSNSRIRGCGPPHASGDKVDKILLDWKTNGSDFFTRYIWSEVSEDCTRGILKDQSYHTKKPSSSQSCSYFLEQPITFS